MYDDGTLPSRGQHRRNTRPRSPGSQGNSAKNKTGNQDRACGKYRVDSPYLDFWSDISRYFVSMVKSRSICGHITWNITIQSVVGCWRQGCCAELSRARENLVKNSSGIFNYRHDREGQSYHLCSHDIARLLGCSTLTADTYIQSLPFALNDVAAGTETKLQAAVVGGKDAVDLPVIIETSNYYANIMRRTASGDRPKSLMADLDCFLNINPVFLSPPSPSSENVECLYFRRLLSGSICEPVPVWMENQEIQSARRKTLPTSAYFVQKCHSICFTSCFTSFVNAM